MAECHDSSFRSNFDRPYGDFGDTRGGVTNYEIPTLNSSDEGRETRNLGLDALVVGVAYCVLLADLNTFLESSANAVLPKPVDLAG